MAFTINNGTDSTLESIYATDYWIVNKWFGDRLWGWGRDNYGQLGNNTTVVYTSGISSPVQNITGSSNWKQVASGYWETSAIKTDGTLWTWGYNAFGGCGDDTRTARSSPVQTISGGSNWKAVSRGYAFGVAIKTDGTLWSWGYNNIGQLGDNTVANKSSPVQTITRGTTWKLVAAGNHHTAAIKTDGTLWMWGANYSGSLGDNTVVHKSSPVQTIAGGTNWRQVACGDSNTAAIKTDGTLWCWGSNVYGTNGDGSSIDRSSPVQTIAGGTNWKFVSVGSNVYMSAIKTDGTLWSWGYNVRGQLGDNSIIMKSSPVQTIAVGTNWKYVACGYHTAAIKTDGTLWMWGENTHGELGDNTNIWRSSPIQTIAGGSNWKQVSCANTYTHAISINNINTTGT